MTRHLDDRKILELDAVSDPCPNCDSPRKNLRYAEMEWDEDGVEYELLRLVCHDCRAELQARNYDT